MKKLLSLCMVCCVTYTQAAVRYVNMPGSGSKNGTSWANAFDSTQLQQAINSSQPGDQVWVAAGTYKPTTGNNRSLSFSLKSGVQVLGGFEGTETQLSQRKVKGIHYPMTISVLSGRIGGGVNSYKVVSNAQVDSTAVLDGFRIENGFDDRAPSSSGDGLGGGIYNHGMGAGNYCSPTIRNCHITNNHASWGGGAFNNGINGGKSRPIYINCVFTNNNASQEAGGMDSYAVRGNASPTLINCLFADNQSATNVGAMYAWGGNGGRSVVTLIHCAFINNRAYNGYCGAFIASNMDENNSSSSGTAEVNLINSLVWGNTATGTFASQQFYVRGTGASVSATYSCIDMQGQNGVHVLSGAVTGNISKNPQIISTTYAGADFTPFTADDGYPLTVTSPCVDAGIAGQYATDLKGNPRGTMPDMGVFELISTQVGQAEQVPCFLYPNPAGETCTIQWPAQPGLWLLTDLNGKNVAGNEWNSSNSIGLSQLPAGMYLCHLFTGNNHAVVKLMKQ